MIRLIIDNREVNVPEGTTVLKAAESIGIHIPNMCYMDGFSNSPSCMLCLVKNINDEVLLPSCAMRVTENMEIITNDEEISEARKEALELLLSDHVGDCEAPCRRSCPAFMNIPLMNRLIASGHISESIKVVKEEIALPLILGYICSAPCEKACRRKQIDSPVSICLLKKYVAASGINNTDIYLPPKQSNTKKKIAVIGTGPAGLASAFYLLKWGHNCVLFDKNEIAGGSLLNVQDDELPKSILENEIKMIEKYGGEFNLNKTITKDILEKIKRDFDAVIIATGEIEKADAKYTELQLIESDFNNESGTYETGTTGVFACGSVIRNISMAVRAVAQGKASALSVNNFLLGKKPEKATKLFNSKFNKLADTEIDEYLKESVSDNVIIPKEGKLNGFTSDEAVDEAKRCLHCDCRKPDTCKLRLYANEYKASAKKYMFADRKLIKKSFQHEYVVYESEKCIKCGLCVEITSANGELTGLSFVGRGFDVQVDIPMKRSLKEALISTAEKCVEACPTGALAFKNDNRKLNN